MYFYMSKNDNSEGHVLKESEPWSSNMLKKSQSFGFLFLALLFVGGCQSGKFYVPVAIAGQTLEAQRRYYTVSPGETLYSIAFRYGLDYKQIAADNNIEPPFTIYENQKLVLHSTKNPSSKKRQKTVTRAEKRKPLKLSNKSQDPDINWHWPVEGEVVKRFALTGNVNKGVDIRGSLGESVNSAADGIVVYAGGGLRGYGKLVIVKHDQRFISAYGHNREILVKEGDKVKGGQVVAEIGSSGLNQEMLHFEIRKDGKPEDPLNYLPNRDGAL